MHHTLFWPRCVSELLKSGSEKLLHEAQEVCTLRHVILTLGHEELNAVEIAHQIAPYKLRQGTLVLERKRKFENVGRAFQTHSRLRKRKGSMLHYIKLFYTYREPGYWHANYNIYSIWNKIKIVFGSVIKQRVIIRYAYTDTNISFRKLIRSRRGREPSLTPAMRLSRSCSVYFTR